MISLKYGILVNLTKGQSEMYNNTCGEAGKMAQLVKAWPALPQDPGSNPVHTWRITTSVTPV